MLTTSIGDSTKPSPWSILLIVAHQQWSVLLRPTDLQRFLLDAKMAFLYNLGKLCEVESMPDSLHGRDADLAPCWSAHAYVY
jgi:hypothetical protein